MARATQIQPIPTADNHQSLDKIPTDSLLTKATRIRIQDTGQEPMWFYPWNFHSSEHTVCNKEDERTTETILRDLRRPFFSLQHCKQKGIIRNHSEERNLNNR